MVRLDRRHSAGKQIWHRLLCDRGGRRPVAYPSALCVPQTVDLARRTAGVLAIPSQPGVEHPTSLSIFRDARQYPEQRAQRAAYPFTVSRPIGTAHEPRRRPDCVGWVIFLFWASARQAISRPGLGFAGSSRGHHVFGEWAPVLRRPCLSHAVWRRSSRNGGLVVTPPSAMAQTYIRLLVAHCRDHRRADGGTGALRRKLPSLHAVAAFFSAAYRDRQARTASAVLCRYVRMGRNGGGSRPRLQLASTGHTSENSDPWKHLQPGGSH